MHACVCARARVRMREIVNLNAHMVKWQHYHSCKITRVNNKETDGKDNIRRCSYCILCEEHLQCDDSDTSRHSPVHVVQPQDGVDEEVGVVEREEMLPRHLVPPPPASSVDEHDDGTSSTCRCRRQVQIEQVLTQVARPRLGRDSAKSLADLFHLFFGRFSRILQVSYDVETPFIGHCCSGFRLAMSPSDARLPPLRYTSRL